MMVHLGALVIVPALAMPVFAMLFSADRLEDAASARRVAVEMHQVVALEGVRSALRDEALDAGLRTIALQLDTDFEDLQASLGDVPTRPIPESRAATDRAIEAVRAADHSGSASATELARALSHARGVVDGALAAPDAGADDGWTVYLRYDEVYELISRTQQGSIHEIVVGRHGEMSRRVLDASFELAVTRELGEVVFRQLASLQGLATAPEVEAERSLIYRIDSDRRTSAALLETWPPVLSDASAERWARFAEDPDFLVFDGFLQSVIDRGADTTGTDEPISMKMPEFVKAGTAVIPISEAVGELIGGSVDRGVRAAAQDEREAELNARLAVAATVALLVVMFTGLILVGGALRRNLLHLVSAASRLRSGRLERVPVEGPREIALLAEALNDAVDNLGRVATQAEVLASGQLDDPSLQEPVPGALGRAVHASFERVVDVVRELERLRTELAHQVAHDRLTGLPNRAEGERLLVQTLDRAGRSGKPAAVLFVDLDEFKGINDTLGHAAGDQVLVAAAERMVATVRPEDTVCRLGGDEFVVVLEGSGPRLAVEEATEVAHRIRAALAEPIHFHGTTVAVGASIGIAFSGGVTDPAVLRSQADTAMYRAKAAGADGIEVYDERLDASGLPRRPVRHRNRGAAGAPRSGYHPTKAR